MSQYTDEQTVNLIAARDSLPAKLVGQRYIEGGCYCAIGYMAHKAGMSDEEIGKGNSFTIISYSTSVCGIRESLKEEYGLSESDMNRIQSANDRASDVHDRRHKVYDAISQIIEERLGGEQ